MAQGKSGRSCRTRTKTSTAVDECDEGEQLVQVMRIILSGIPVLKLNDMNDIATLDEAVSSPAPKGTLLMWNSAYLVEILKEQ